MNVMAAELGASENGQQQRIPTAAALLGAGGLIPFVGLSAAAHLAPAEQAPIAVHALTAYGAVILSFLGGIIWGLGIAGFGEAADKPRETLRLTVSVLPSLFGWLALFFPPVAGLWLLATCFLLVLSVDLLMAQRGLTPRWYPALRWRLTAIVVLSLLAASAA